MFGLPQTSFPTAFSKCADHIYQLQLCRSDTTIEVHFFLDLQTPTSKQSKYKEQVAEMRKGRNSGLQKEQKEKHMVHH